MTDAEPADRPGRCRWLNAWSNNPFAKALMSATLFAAAVATVLTYVQASGEANGGGTASPTASSSSSVAPPAPSGTTTAEDPAPPPVPVVGSCVDTDGALAACDGPHAGEVFATDDCSEEALLAHLGGQPGRDVLRELPTASRSIGGTTVCTVAAPDGARTDGSHRDVLLRAEGDAWRRCQNQLQREVGCAQPHVAEVVFERGNAADPLDCARRADDYLGTPFASKSADLQLLQDERRCLIAVRGDNVLTGSLRRLGSSSLPLQAAPN
ncbi:hypothetical protein [Modestobacter sp. SYSU DS0511]